MVKNIKPFHILLTGATGLIGQDLLIKLLKKDYQVTAITRNPKKLLKHPNLNVIQVDLINLKNLNNIKKPDVVIHLAASLSTFESNNQLKNTNQKALANLLDITYLLNPHLKFIFASSIDAKTSNSDYAKSKRKGEKIIKNFACKHPTFKPIIIRIGNVESANSSFISSIASIINKRNFKASILYHTLAGKYLYLINLNTLTNKILTQIKSNKHINKTIEMYDQKITIKQIIKNQQNKNIIRYTPAKTPLTSILLKFWILLGKITKRADLLIYLYFQK